jgi:predicted nuclease of predicted toxin-antitoxin system
LSSKSKKITVLLDEGTPIGVAKPFKDQGHRVIYHHQVLFPMATDDEVVRAAIMNEAALIAVDLDMKRLARRYGAPQNIENVKYPKLNLIFMTCDGVMAEKRMAHAMTFLENEWAVCCEKVARRLWVNIEPHRLSTYR